MFGKDKGDGGYPEINTIRGDVAYFKFDRPISNLYEISGRKVTDAELIRTIEVVNNRRTDDRTDDIHLHIANGPLYFSEEKHQIWTHDCVYLRDEKSKPKPMEIRGKGMQLDLLTEAPPAKPGTRKPRQEAITGVKRIVLLANVEMYLYADSKSSFPAGGHEEAGKKAPPAKAAEENSQIQAADIVQMSVQVSSPPPAKNGEEKAQIIIKTPGRFTYNFGKEKEQDVAVFEAPENPGQDLLEPGDVMVTRHQPQINGEDKLICQKLVLRLRRKAQETKKPAGPAGPGTGSPEENLQIEMAHATGPEVTLISDTEKLEAHCVELIHDVRDPVTTTLRGNPKMMAKKDGNVIHCRELQIKEVKLPADKTNPEGKKGQQVDARGPGQIDLLNRTTNKITLHAVWMDRLTTSRDGPYDLLVLTGKARFVDDEHNQDLQAETLKVWLEEKPAPAAKPRASGGPEATGPVASVERSETSNGPQAQQPQSNRRPHHLEGLRDVSANSPEMILRDASQLTVWFKDVPEEALLVAPPRSSAAPGADRGPALGPDKETGKQGDKETRPSTSSPGRPATPAAEKSDNPDKKDPQPPIHLSARTVQAWVLRSEVKSVLDKLWTEGSVHVQQDPAKPEEKGVDIRGETLQLKYHPDGHHLVVSGPMDLAHVQLDKIYILGPEVNIDQAANKVWVTGVGAMRMDSDTTFSGEKMTKTVPLTVHWNQSMLFNGKFAEFHGGIQADQENARLTCQSMQVFFDRPISLKQGNSGDKPVKVQTLVCDRSVRIEDSVMEGNKLVKWQQITGAAVEVYALENEEADARPKPNSSGTSKSEGNQLKAWGPGTVRIFQPGSSDPLSAPPPNGGGSPPNGGGSPPNGGAPQGGQQGQPRPQGQPAAKPPSKPGEAEEMKLTFITFTKNMSANNKSNKANFWGNVQVLNMPSDNPQKEIDLITLLDHMPKDAFYLSCEQLMVLSRKENGRTNQEMEAKRRVMVQAREFSGRCDVMTYNEAKDQIIFFGTDAELARLFRVVTPGAPPEEIKGKKIIYIRSTGDFQVDGGNWINGR
jgi:hypothetical protein